MSDDGGDYVIGFLVDKIDRTKTSPEEIRKMVKDLIKFGDLADTFRSAGFEIKNFDIKEYDSDEPDGG